MRQRIRTKFYADLFSPESGRLKPEIFGFSGGNGATGTRLATVSKDG